MTTPEHPAPDLRQAAVQAREALHLLLMFADRYGIDGDAYNHILRAHGTLDAALSAPPAQEQAGQMVSDEQIQAAVFAVLRKWKDDRAWDRYTRETGPYDVTELRAEVLEIIRAVLAAVQQEGAAPKGEVRNVTAREDRFLRAAVLRSSTLVHGGKLVIPARADAPIGESKEWDGKCVLGHCGSPSGCERDGLCRAAMGATPIAGQPATSSEAAPAPVVPADETALRAGVRQLTLALREREWADLLTTDSDLAALDEEVRKLLGERHEGL